MKKYVSYIRVSTAQQGESGLGLGAQVDIIEHFTKDGEIIARFKDVASGKSMANRPELKKAIDLCKKEGATLVVAKCDRLSRNVQDALSILDSLGKDGLLSCDLPNSDRFTMTIIFAVAERERLLISIRTKAALNQAKKRGISIGRRAGYTHHDETKNKMSESLKKTNPSFSEFEIQVMDSLRKDGLSYAKIAERLQEMGLKSPTGKEIKPQTVKYAIDKIKNN
jgi:DNA invertase Pin-like site-specific DNA recombinase